jgi:hypothetical protein
MGALVPSVEAAAMPRSLPAITLRRVTADKAREERCATVG